MNVYPPINPALLGQAAATAREDLWIKFPVLQQWINGDKKPTVKQLADFAKEVHIPFGFFFLDQLPVKQNTIPLFRTNSRQAQFEYSYELSQTITDIQRRQDWLVDYLRSEGEAPLSFVGRFNSGSHTNIIVNDIRNTIELPVNWSRFLQDKDAALKYLIEKVEAVGIYVAVNGVLGNSNKNLDPEEFKGFVLSNKWAPYIFINGKDFPAAKIFTLMHELAHIWLGETAILDIEQLMPANTDIEKLCDSVAASLLVDAGLLMNEWNKVKLQANHLQILERYFKVSQLMIARRLMDIGAYSKTEFFAFYRQQKALWDAKENTGGGSFYANQPYRVGKKFFQWVNEATATGKLLFTDAYKLTNLYGSTFHAFKAHLEGR
jgi:Zn-dependent peptidase ImmA (M78 family)